MDERIENKRKEVFEVKQFPFTLPSEEIKKNITINTTNNSKFTKLSKQKIINQALKLHSEGNISEASKYYKFCINKDFNNYKIYSNYGVILKNLGKLKEAEILIRKAIKIKPDFAKAHTNLGSILKEQGKLKEAEISIREAIKIQPDLADSHSTLGLILIESGKLKEAEESIRKAIKIKPDLAEAHSNLGKILIDLGNIKEAEASVQKAIKHKPDLAEAHFNLGNILKDSGKLLEAEKSTRKAIEIRPDFAKAQLNLGNILNSLGQLKEAEIEIRKAIEISKDYIDAHIILGNILSDLGKPEEASIYEWQAIKLNPLFDFLESYRDNLKLINKIGFYVFSYTIFNHYRPIIEINPELFEIVVPDYFEEENIVKIRKDLKRKDIKIRYHKELIDNNLFYEKLVSNNVYHTNEIINDKGDISIKGQVPTIKLLGKKNINFMYTAGKSQITVSYWTKYYDGILCFGPYHEQKFKLKNKIPISQMGYPRFDKYFKPGFKRDELLKKFKCNPKKKTIIWLTTWSELSSVDKYLKAISSLINDYNIVVRPHPTMKKHDPENYKKLFTIDFNYIDDNEDDNVQLYAIADLMFFDYGGSMFGALYLKKNFAFLEMNSKAKNHIYLGSESSEDYLKSFFPDRVANLENLKFICDYCLKNPPSNSIMNSLREEFFNTNYLGNSAKRAYDILIEDNWPR